MLSRDTWEEVLKNWFSEYYTVILRAISPTE